MSRNPAAPSVLFGPTDTNVVGMFVASPAVYCMSRLYQVMLVSRSTPSIHKDTYCFRGSPDKVGCASIDCFHSEA